MDWFCSDVDVWAEGTQKKTAKMDISGHFRGWLVSRTSCLDKQLTPKRVLSLHVELLARCSDTSYLWGKSTKMFRSGALRNGKKSNEKQRLGVFGAFPTAKSTSCKIASYGNCSSKRSIAYCGQALIGAWHLVRTVCCAVQNVRLCQVLGPAKMIGFDRFSGLPKG